MYGGGENAESVCNAEQETTTQLTQHQRYALAYWRAISTLLRFYFIPSVIHYFHEIKPTYWLAVVRKCGHLELFSVNDLTVRESFLTPNVHMARRLLVNTRPETVQESSITNNIVEMGIFGLGHMCRRPLIVMRAADFKILLYEVIPAIEGCHDDSLKIRLRKLNHCLLLKETKIK